MADGVCLPIGFWVSKQLSLNKLFDLSTPSMRKVDDGEKKIKEKRMPAVDRPNADRWNAARPCQKKKRK